MKEMMKKVKERREGFTMAELLIVVAIIAVLVAIAIPVFTSQLEKSREATDLANIRAAYAEVTVKALDNTEATGITETVNLKQQTAGWETATAAQTLQELAGDSSYVTGTPTPTKSVVLTWVPKTTTVDAHVTIAFGA